MEQRALESYLKVDQGLHKSQNETKYFVLIFYEIIQFWQFLKHCDDQSSIHFIITKPLSSYYIPICRAGTLEWGRLCKPTNSFSDYIASLD